MYHANLCTHTSQPPLRSPRAPSAPHTRSSRSPRSLRALLTRCLSPPSASPPLRAACPSARHLAESGRGRGAVLAEEVALVRAAVCVWRRGVRECNAGEHAAKPLERAKECTTSPSIFNLGLFGQCSISTHTRRPHHRRRAKGMRARGYTRASLAQGGK